MKYHALLPQQPWGDTINRLLRILVLSSATPEQLAQSDDPAAPVAQALSFLQQCGFATLDASPEAHWQLTPIGLASIRIFQHIGSPRPALRPREGVAPKDCSVFELMNILSEDGWSCFVLGSRNRAPEGAPLPVPYIHGDPSSSKTWWVKPHTKTVRKFYLAALVLASRGSLGGQAVHHFRGSQWRTRLVTGAEPPQPRQPRFQILGSLDDAPLPPRQPLARQPTRRARRVRGEVDADLSALEDRQSDDTPASADEHSDGTSLAASPVTSRAASPAASNDGIGTDAGHRDGAAPAASRDASPSRRSRASSSGSSGRNSSAASNEVSAASGVSTPTVASPVSPASGVGAGVLAMPAAAHGPAPPLPAPPVPEPLTFYAHGAKFTRVFTDGVHRGWECGCYVQEHRQDDVERKRPRRCTRTFRFGPGADDAARQALLDHLTWWAQQGPLHPSREDHMALPRPHSFH